jgi:hypothetical protein
MRLVRLFISAPAAAAAVALVASSPASPAYAADDDARARDVARPPPLLTTAPTSPPHINIDGHLGFGTPVGWLGAGLSVRPANFIAVSAGAGLGTRGLQLASMLHAYPVALSDHARIGLGAGVSTGRFVTSSLHNADLRWDRYYERAWMLNIQASANIWDNKGSNGFGVEPFLGYGIVMNTADSACSGWKSTCTGRDGVFFIGVTMRYGFWI